MGSLDRSVTHLIVYEPTGKKYLAARRWGLHIVVLQWLEDSIMRGMILDEKCYDPTLPKEVIGKGAWTRREILPNPRTKRQRESGADKHDSRRKLRKTASMKLNSQRENMWGEILGQQPSADQVVSRQTEEPTQPLPTDSMLRPPIEPVLCVNAMQSSFAGTVPRDDNLFVSCCFFIFEFPPEHANVLVDHISSRGGRIVKTLEDATSQDTMLHRFVLIPQNSNPKSHPIVPDGVQVITEFFIERCLHRKSLLSPKDHVIGRPFPVFPIEAFDTLSIGTSGFTDSDLNQVEKTVRQLGARYEERFNAQCTMLVCTALGAVRKPKLDLALFWKVPVVKADWLWECISQGKKLPITDFLFPELNKRVVGDKAGPAKPPNRSKSVSDIGREFTPKSFPRRKEQPTRTSLPGPDISAFDPTPLLATEPSGLASHGKSSSKDDPNYTPDFDTAQTHQTRENTGLQRVLSRPSSRNGPGPLAEKSANDLNKATGEQPPPQPRKPLTRVRSEVCDSEAGDDEDGLVFLGVDDDTQAPNVIETEDPTELEKRRSERETAEKAAAERQALSYKLASLLQGAAMKASNNGFDSGTSRAGNLDSEQLAAPPRRKRGIMGRAISNISAASNESQESSSGRRAMSRTHSAVVREDDSPDEEEPGSAVPPATQIQYDDPEATKSKARLMSKMLGRSSVGVSGTTKMPTEDKVTMGGVRLEQDASYGRTAGGRSMRRR